MNKALEDLQAGRDPFAPKPEEISAERYQNFARWSKWLVIVAGVLCVAFTKGLPASSGPEEAHAIHMMQAVVGVIFLVMLLMSIILGIIALCAIRRCGSEGILKPALAGLILSAIGLGLFATGYENAVQNRKALVAFEANVKKVKADYRADLTNENGATTAGELKKYNAAQAMVDETARNSTGDQALVAQALSAYIAKAKLEMVHYAGASEPIRDLSQFDMSKVTRQDQLESQMQAVKKFMAANDSLWSFTKTGEDFLRNEMLKANLPPDKVDEAMKGFHRGAAPQAELSLKMREQDKKLGEAMLGALGLLDANWGKWTYSAEKHTVLFDDHAVWKKYIAFLQDLDAVDREESRLQGQQIALMK